MAEPDSPSTEKNISSCCSSETDTSKRRFDWLFWGALAGVSLLFLSGWLPKSWFPSWLQIMIGTTRDMIRSMWWGVLIGAIFIGLLSKVPQEFIHSILGKGGSVAGLFRAAGAGVLLDLCNHGILMIGAKLYQRGASTGQVIAFLVASPWNSFSLTLVLIGLIGLPWTLTFLLLSMLIALLTGWIFDRLVDRRILPPNPYSITLPENFQFWEEAKSRLRRTSFNSAFLKDILISGIKDSRMVVRWLLFGILLAAGLRALFNPELFAVFFGPTAVGLLITLLFTTILEVCSEGSTPIASDILTRAQAPGNGFAFLMAGVSTDYTEMMILKDLSKSWKLALFLPLITVPQVLLIGWLLNSYWGG